MIATELQEETEQTFHGEPATVSVVVPSYNHAQFIEATLRSIMKQTLPPAELIVIDDGSSDDSPAVIERVLNDCPFPCELIARDNRGLCATLNEGFERSRGNYFAYLGSDDLWLPDFLKARVACSNRDPTQFSPTATLILSTNKIALSTPPPTGPITLMATCAKCSCKQRRR